MKILFSNKRAQVISMPWHALIIIFILAVIVAVILSSISSVFLSKQDVRPAESVLLARAAAECITDFGIANKNFDLNGCLTLDSRNYFVNATLYSTESNFYRNQVLGAETIKTDCLIADRGVDFGSAPICMESKNYVLIRNGDKLEKGILLVYAGIRKVEENV